MGILRPGCEGGHHWEAWGLVEVERNQISSGIQHWGLSKASAAAPISE